MELSRFAVAGRAGVGTGDHGAGVTDADTGPGRAHIRKQKGTRALRGLMTFGRVISESTGVAFGDFAYSRAGGNRA